MKNKTKRQAVGQMQEPLAPLKIIELLKAVNKDDRSELFLDLVYQGKFRAFTPAQLLEAIQLLEKDDREETL